MYFIRLDTSKVKDELWDVIQHNLLRNLSKHGMRKPHIGRRSRPRLKAGPVQLKEFSVPSAIHPLLYGYEDSTPECWNPSQLWGHELTCLDSSMLTSYEGCRARPSLPKQAPYCLECWMLQEGGRSGSKTSFLPFHSPSSWLFIQNYKIQSESHSPPTDLLSSSPGQKLALSSYISAHIC